MPDKVTVFNIRKQLPVNKDYGEDTISELLSDFSCTKNPDIELFLKKHSIEFTKKNQSVTYLVFSNDDASLLGYFTIAIKPLHINGTKFSNTLKRKLARVSQADLSDGIYTLSAYLIAQLGKNYAEGANNRITGVQLLQAAIDTIKKIQYMAGGMVIFLETENKEKLLHFYEKENGFIRFDTKKVNSASKGEHTLIQLLKIL